MRRLSLLLALSACQVGGGGDSGLVVVSDTAQMGPPPACNDDTPTTGAAGETGDTGGDDAEAVSREPDELSSRTGASRAPDELSSRTGGSRAPDPGASFCAGFTSHAACDGTARMDGDTVVGECRWTTVVPVVPGTCEATQLYETCVHVPLTGGPCEAAGSCGQVGLGVYGREGCDGTVEIIVVPPGEAYCAAPTDWPLCWPDDTAPECTCVCE
jgi:hypothetical protein